MATSKSRDTFPTKYESTNIRLERTATHLIALLVADKHLKYAYKKFNLYNLLEASIDVEESDVIQMTVELATGYRLIHWNSTYHEETHPVGDLWPDAALEKTEDLTVLEACHKIIHATDLTFWKRKVRGFPTEYMEPYLLVSGTKGKRRWEAQIHMLLFCNEVLARHSDLPPTSK